MRGILAIAIVLLFLLLPAIAIAQVYAYPDPVFTEGFESGNLLLWEDGSNPPPETTAVIVNDIVRSGTCAAKILNEKAILLHNYLATPLTVNLTYGFWLNFSFLASDGANVQIYAQSDTEGVAFDSEVNSAYGQAQGAMIIYGSGWDDWSYYADNTTNMFNDYWDNPLWSLTNSSWQDIAIHVHAGEVGVDPYVVALDFYVNGSFRHYAVAEGANFVSDLDLIYIVNQGATGDLYVDDISVGYDTDPPAPEPEPDTFQFLFSVDYLIFLLMVLIPTIIMWAKFGEIAVAPTFDLMCVVAWIGNVIPLGVLIIALLISLGTYINRGAPENG